MGLLYNNSTKPVCSWTLFSLSQEPKAAIMPKYGTSCSVALPKTKKNHTKNKVTVKATLFIDNLCPCAQNIYLKQRKHI